MSQCTEHVCTLVWFISYWWYIFWWVQQASLIYILLTLHFQAKLIPLPLFGVSICVILILGESDTRHRDSNGANGIRIVFAVWILYCVIIAASYSGALKASFTLPVYQPPIDTLKDVLDSGLPWGMVWTKSRLEFYTIHLSPSITISRSKDFNLKSQGMNCFPSQVLYGEGEEGMMATSEDPVIRRIWDEKIVSIV